MKKASTLFFLILLFGCSSEGEEKNSPGPVKEPQVTQEISIDYDLLEDEEYNGILPKVVDQIHALNIENEGSGAVKITDQKFGKFSYIPAKDYSGQDSFSVIQANAEGKAARIKVNLNIAQINDAPVATDKNVTTDEDKSVSITLEGTDAENESLVTAVVKAPEHGKLVADEAGGFVYTPDPNFFGSDTLTFSVVDPQGASDEGEIAISVLPIKDAPTAISSTINTSEDTPKLVTLKAETVETSTLVYSIKTAPTKGQLTQVSEDKFNYTPNLNVNGTDTFVFEVADGDLRSEATVNINIGSENDIPVAVAKSISVLEDMSLTDVVLSATDVENDPLTFHLPQGQGTRTTHGNLNFSGSGTFSYTPDSNYCGTDKFSFYVRDGSDSSSPVDVTISVTCVDDPPVANALVITAKEDTQVQSVVTASDVENDSLVYSITVQPTHGVVTLTSSTGAFTYLADQDYYGSDSFKFRATTTKNSAVSNEALVTITVSALPNIVQHFVLTGSTYHPQLSEAQILTRRDRFGESIASPGDLDLDGVPDIVVGAPKGLKESGNFGEGLIEAFSGSNGMRRLTYAGPSGSYSFGMNLSSAGDLGLPPDGRNDFFTSDSTKTYFVNSAGPITDVFNDDSALVTALGNQFGTSAPDFIANGKIFSLNFSTSGFFCAYLPSAYC